MPRKKPFSNKQRKAQLQEKRAIKRGDASPPPPAKRNLKQKRRHLASRSAAAGTVDAQAVTSSRKLQSTFIKLSPAYLEKSRLIASKQPLPRPLPPTVAIFSPDDLDQANEGDARKLSCPKRPKWRYDMTKTEVEKNEEGLFKKWLDQTDQVLKEWVDRGPSPSGVEVSNQGEAVMPRAPTHFERNLEVWRQLWRVSEISQILLILLDSRCPFLHYPPSLASYLAGLPNRKIILVLTKVDISGPDRANAWSDYLKKRYPHVRIVQVESYVPKELGPNNEGTSKRGRRFEPHLPHTFRERLVQALREVHQELLQPPELIRGDEVKMKHWKPSVKTEVDWDEVLSARGDRVGQAIGGPIAPRPSAFDATAENEGLSDEKQEMVEAVEPEFLTVGLIGQPNVGKSSLLNALFGTIKVRASRTPGKTKHFQTLFWTPDVRLVDCPGLVMPNFVPMETQARIRCVLSGILPISKVSAISACVHHVSQLLPPERVFGLTHPTLSTPAAEDKRTWREPRTQDQSQKSEPTWTATDVLTAYAGAKNWVTAKAGRPDVNRAGNAILRALAEGRIRWAFWPPGTDPSVHDKAGDGIWIRSGDDAAGVGDSESDDGEEEVEQDPVLDSGGEGSEEEEDEDEGGDETNIGGRFGALALEDAVAESTEEE
ncbi:P-loop containing nucleoside triphosphate hydrolase protein [Thelephora ganbajun]|uniref:P-loop containing nucleoside triphosphate hydrolase protein n=1 Tax=Thelephora ganbajun TaxID=370292 RepID=A0ACB6ZXS0_THEGA|nr:P-loop containing nucleoside triphosphate hydrolase protein [Thelephora ganbajun]